MTPAQEFNRKAGEGAEAGLGWSGPPAIANGEIRYRLMDRNGKTLKPVA
ncbi:hypothetical protein NKL07_33415 [Mesorhizobium sp. C280B]|nr:hypothetical protein [Mesorhizobium sp. LSJC280B00]ESW77806.1 hypothetical protein X772_30315 [Mesorhizobium sp. LSJC280B00]